MDGAITDIKGVAVGHASDVAARTGCTVLLCPEGAEVGVDVRGRAPATRETDLCRPGGLVKRANAIFLTGGSAFGLDAASGVMRYLFERGIGFPTGVIPVPIVPAAAIFDLGFGAPVWPDASMAYAACEAASPSVRSQGSVGAGCGATVGKVLGMAGAMRSGVGTASRRVGHNVVGALVVVNAMGDVVAEDGSIMAGARRNGIFIDTSAYLQSDSASSHSVNTTIGVVATDGAIGQEGAGYLAAMGQVGLARSIRPVHTMVDGDTIFGLVTGGVAADDLTRLGEAAAEVMAAAVRNAVRQAGGKGAS